MSFVPYKTTSSIWNNIQGQVYGKRFYPLQKGSGADIKIVSPAQGSVQRAKSNLKRQMSQTKAHSPTTKRRRKTPVKKTANKKRKIIRKKTTSKIKAATRKKKK